jgi:hypothetical protein
MILLALSASFVGAGYLGFSGSSFSIMAVWTSAWAAVLLWSNRVQMRAALEDNRQPDDPAVLPILSVATMIVGATGLLLIIHAAAFYFGAALARF